MKNIIEDLNWRYATKKFDANSIISEEKINVLLESIRLTPSSYGLQPYKVIVVKNEDLRVKTLEIIHQDINQISRNTNRPFNYFSSVIITRSLGHTLFMRSTSTIPVFGSIVIFLMSSIL